jgi:hypothetical protein
MSANWTEKEWRQHIENRRQGSAIWQFIHILGSLRLAMVLLFTILVACAVATLYESKFTAQVAQVYVYKSQWFIFWLAVLCINLFCVTLTRYPWRKKHTGFVITHYGIIVMLIGAAIGQKLGFEANVTLRVGGGATRDLVINRTIMQVQSGTDRLAYKIPINVHVGPPTPERPKDFSLPGSKLRLRIDNYSTLGEAPELIASPLPNSGAGVALEFSSGMMAQSVPVLLTRLPEEASHNDFFGRARIELLDQLPDRSAVAAANRDFEETQVVFAKAEPVVALRKGKASGYRLALVLEGVTPKVIVEAPHRPSPGMGHAAPKREMFELSAVMGKPFSLAGETVKIHVQEYWPDMEMKDGRPESKSNEPNNPAVMVTLTGVNEGEKPLLEIAPAEGGGIVYQVSRAGAIEASGKAAVGEAFQLGWADWKALVKQALPNAMINKRLVPMEETKATGDLTPGISARLFDRRTKTQGDAEWVPSGRGVMVRLGEESAFVGFGLEVHKLPFTLELLKFEVPRYPGTQTPSDFQSTVRFTDSATGKTMDALIHMNYPASFPESFLQTALGRNFKFSQAQWNAKDLNETTLQVLHDPGWPLKWTGSLAICIGIAIMFYGKPASSAKGRKPKKVETV